MDEVYEVIGISNREARFALLVMGILNAFVVIAASRPEVVGALVGVVRVSAAAPARHLRRDGRATSCSRRSKRCGPGKFRPRLENWATER